MEIDEENKEQDGEGNSEKEIQEPEETEQATDQDNNEERLQEEGPQKAEEEVEEAEEKENIPDAAKDSENNENKLPTEQGLTPQVI